MFASFLALTIGIALTFGILMFAIQYTANETFMTVWFITALILASWQIADKLTPYITKLLP